MQTQSTAPLDTSATQHCPKCDKTLPKTSFNKGRTYCKPCSLAWVKECKQRHENPEPKPKRVWTDEQRRAASDRRYQAIYNMSLDEIEAWSASQGGLCSICHGPQTNGKPLLSISWVPGPEPGQKIPQALLCSECITLKLAIPLMDAKPEKVALVRAALATPLETSESAPDQAN